MSKLNLHCGNNPKPDYENYESRLDLIEDSEAVLPCFDDYMLLDRDPNTIEEICANVGCLESLPREQLVPVMDRWNELLVENGILKLNTFDIHLITNNFVYDRFTVLEYEKIVQQMRSFHTYDGLLDLFEACKFKVDMSTYCGEYSSFICSKMKTESKEEGSND